MLPGSNTIDLRMDTQGNSSSTMTRYLSSETGTTGPAFFGVYRRVTLSQQRTRKTFQLCKPDPMTTPLIGSLLDRNSTPWLATPGRYRAGPKQSPRYRSPHCAIRPASRIFQRAIERSAAAIENQPYRRPGQNPGFSLCALDSAVGYGTGRRAAGSIGTARRALEIDLQRCREILRPRACSNLGCTSGRAEDRRDH